MSDPMTTPPPAPATAPPPPPAAGAPSAMSNMMASFSQAELMVVGGSLLIALVDIVFGLVTRDYSLGQLPWAVATVTLLAVLGPRIARISLPIATETIVVMAGVVMLFVGARDLLYDLRSLSAGHTSTTFVLAMVGYYVGVALLFFGAWTVWRRRPA